MSVIYLEVRIIVIDALANTEVFVEKKKLITITANYTKNNDGYLRVDDSNNPLISMVDSGHTPLYRVKEYTGKDYLMLYNQTTKQMQLVKTGHFINISVDFVSGVKYFLNAKRILVTQHTKNIFHVDLKGYRIFKVFLDNGIELFNYTYDDTSLTVKGLEKNFIEDFTEIVLFVYTGININKEYEITVSRDENNSKPILEYEETQYSDITFSLEYYNYNSVYDSTSFMDGSYFENGFLGNELLCFDKLTINENIEKETTKNNFRVCDKSIIKSIEVTAELETFDVDDLSDMVQYVGKDEFRLLLVNPVFGRIFLINNCILNNGVPMTFQKESNMKNCKISCGNYIDIKITDSREYSRGKYGKGMYGSGTWIINSHRREV